jgi:steroid delta-isomerase-like uncharacterized protein
MSVPQGPEGRSPQESARAILTAVGHRDLAALEKLYSPDVVDEVVATGVLRGWSEVRAYLADFFEAFPDAMVTVRRTVAGGDCVAVEWEWSGSHEGPGPREPALLPTRRLVTLRSLEFMEFRAGLLVRNTAYSDFGSVARQLRLMPAAGSRTETVALGATNFGGLVRDGVSRLWAAAGGVVAAGRARATGRSDAAQAAIEQPPAAAQSPPASPREQPLPPPPPSAAAQLAARLIEALDAHDLDAAASLWNPDVVEVFPTGLCRGRDAVRAEFAGFIAAMPDFSLRPLGYLAEGDLAVVRWRATGTHTGTKLRGLRATGARLEFAGADLIEVQDGVIVTDAVYYDTATVARQLGALPPRGSGQERFLVASANAVTRVRDQAKSLSSWMTERLR